MVDDSLCHQCSDERAQTIGHHHKQALCAAADALVRLLIDEQRTRDIEEVKGYAIDKHRKQEKPYATARVTQSEEGKTQYPSEKRDKNHTLDT